jgi:hypothetical protein
VVAAGAHTFVVGSSIFDGTANIGANVDRLRSAIGAGDASNPSDSPSSI